MVKRTIKAERLMKKKTNNFLQDLNSAEILEKMLQSTPTKRMLKKPHFNKKLRGPYFSCLSSYEVCFFDCHFATTFVIGSNEGVPRYYVNMLHNYKISCVFI